MPPIKQALYKFVERLTSFAFIKNYSMLISKPKSDKFSDSFVS